MGAALTYARRYALFTLVGIAGEDDLDAPDLPAIDGGPVNPHNAGNGHVEVAPNPSFPVRTNGLHRKARPRVPVLDVEASSALARRLTGEIASLGSAEAAIEWARQTLGAKNTLTAGDAGSVEAAFRARMLVLEPKVHPLNAASTSEDLRASGLESQQLAPEPPDGQRPPSTTSRPQGIDKSSLALTEPRRYRNKDHVRFVATQPCTVCGRQPSDPHHLRFAQRRALGRKVSDEFTVPLCRIHHRELHRKGDEAAWWSSLNIDPMPVALSFWQHSRCVAGAADIQDAKTDGSAQN
jgi:hypothetical protein